jgi:hypothetical protein
MHGHILFQLHREAAYDFRGHVTIKLKAGQTVEGFVFNRQYDNPLMPEDNFIEIFLKGDAEKSRYKISEIESIGLTGEDFAAGNSYEDYLKKKKASST